MNKKKHNNHFDGNVTVSLLLLAVAVVVAVTRTHITTNISLLT